MQNQLRRARDGCSNEVSFMKKPVYHYSMQMEPPLVYSTILDKKQWIRDNIKNEENYEMVSFMMIDWDLYQGGWVVTSYDNPGLFYYLCQIGNWGSHRPSELEYFIEN
tara:strand:+ start:8883 stop:9206 length:324 start_codon:yes stop_codon:yes gene_type:complete